MPGNEAKRIPSALSGPQVYVRQGKLVEEVVQHWSDKLTQTVRLYKCPDCAWAEIVYHVGVLFTRAGFDLLLRLGEMEMDRELITRFDSELDNLEGATSDRSVLFHDDNGCSNCYCEFLAEFWCRLEERRRVLKRGVDEVYGNEWAANYYPLVSEL